VELERAYDQYGLPGWSLSSFMTGVAADDRRYYPLYALSERLGKTVQIHSAGHFNPSVPFEISHPQHIDRVAMDFPGLRIVMCHAGYGFGTEGLTIVRRHENVWADFSGLHPKALSQETVAYINGMIADRAIFGTNYPCLEYSIVDAYRKLIRPEVQERFFAGNARRALGLGA
jgi:uncharacterized protein